VCHACGCWEFDKKRGATCEKCGKPFQSGAEQPVQGKEGGDNTKEADAGGQPQRLHQLVDQLKQSGGGAAVDEVLSLLGTTLGLDVHAALKPFLPTTAPAETQSAIWRAAQQARKAHGKAKAAVESAQKDLEAKQAELDAVKTKLEQAQKLEKEKSAEDHEASQRYCSTFPEAEGKPPEENPDKEKEKQDDPMDLSGDQMQEEREELKQIKREFEEKSAKLVQKASAKKAKITTEMEATASKVAEAAASSKAQDDGKGAGAARGGKKDRQSG
jgi:Skp family chaperone for outer membrane proteins